MFTVSESFSPFFSGGCGGGGLVSRERFSQNVNANLITSAVDVYQVTFSVFGVYYVTFYTSRVTSLLSLTPIYFILKNYMLQINMLQPHRQINMYIIF